MLNEEQKALAETFLTPFESAQQLRDWIFYFFGIDFPLGRVDPDSNSSPSEWLFEAYCAIRDNLGAKNPTFVIYSARECYKCQVKGSNLLTPQGITKIENIKVGDVVWSGKNWRKVTDWIDDGIKDGITLNLENGVNLTSTPIHRYWVLRNGVEQWVKTVDLLADDLVCYNIDTPLSKGFKINEESYDKGRFLGMLAGDGGVSSIDSETHSHFAFTTIDKTLKDQYYKFCARFLGVTPKPSKHDPITHCVWNKDAIKKLKKMGVVAARSWEKTIPDYCYSSNSAMLGFVSGLFDTDGTFNSTKAIDFPITASKILKELQFVFASWGIKSKYRPNSKLYGNQKHLIHHLLIGAHDSHKLFDLGMKNQAVKAGKLHLPLIYDAHDSIPLPQVKFFFDFCEKIKRSPVKRKNKKPKISPRRNKGDRDYLGITYGKLNSLVVWAEESISMGLVDNEKEVIDRIKSILNNRWYSFTSLKEKTAHFFDLTVEEDHSYWSNGSISHNTLSCSALEVIALVHFEVTIAHMAAIEPQSKKAVSYITNFLRKIKPYLEYHGRNIESQNTRNISIKNEDGDECYLTVIICTLTGANCIHPDTIIHYMDGTLKPANEVKPGDTLKTWDYTKHEMIPVVVGSTSYTEKHSREILFEDGSNIVVSDDHQVFTQKGWIPACNVRLGDKFTDFAGGTVNPTRYKKSNVKLGSLDQFIKGSLLGDSSLYRTANLVRFQVSHCKAQLEYLEAIQDLFTRNDIESSIIPDGTQFKLTTKTHPIFEEYLWTHTPTKVVTKRWLEGLNYEGIACWFMGDGHGNEKAVGKSKNNRFTLATCCFSREENKLIVDYFTDLGYPCRIGTTSNGIKTYPVVEFTLQASRDLSEKLRPYFLPDLEYKLLSPTSLDFARCITTGDIVMHPNGHGFSHSGDSPNKTRSGRKWSKRIKEDLTAKVVAVNLIGKINLIDIHIDTKNEHHKSFLANNMKLLHNSEHTNLMCVDGSTKIDVMAESKLAIRADDLHSRMEKGEKLKALSFSHLTGEEEYKAITHHFSDSKKTLELTTGSGDSLIISGDHRVYVVGSGYTEAKNVNKGDLLVRRSNRKPKVLTSPSDVSGWSNPHKYASSTQLDQLLMGSLLGDGGVYRKKQNNAYYQETHSLEQKEYALWKKGLLSNTFRMRDYISVGGYNNVEQIKIASGNTPLLNKWVGFKETFEGVDLLGPLGLAVWYMDDGCKLRGLRLSTEGFTLEQNEKLKQVLKANFDIKVNVKKYKNKPYYYLDGKLEEQYKLLSICRDYIHPSMMYKFEQCLKKERQCRLCGKGYVDFAMGRPSGYCGDSICQSVRKGTLITSAVTSISPNPKVPVYDFTVEDNHNFFCNGNLTHQCIDEVDVVRFPQAYEEAKLIPGMLRGRFPITFMTSTRKFAFGLMQKEIENARELDNPVLHWNIIDITEKCQPERYFPELEKQTRFISRNLPLENISPLEWSNKQDEMKNKYDEIEAYAGCADCKLLPVCRTRLADRPERDVGGLWKPIDFVINQFDKIEPDMAEAQLMCWKPSSTGLIYGRFDESEGENTLTLDQAYFEYTGVSRTGVILDDIIDVFHKKGIKFYIGGDWGYTHAYAMIACAKLPSGETWIFETLAMPGLEYEDMIKYAIYFRDKYKPKRWFMDTAQPMFIKGFRKRRMPCKDFKKDVMGGIEAVRGQVVDARGKRRLKVIKTVENEFLIKGFSHHHFKLDAAGRITQEPDDEEYADVMDSLRYIGQNLFASNGNIKTSNSTASKNDMLIARRKELYEQNPMKVHSDVLVNRIRKLAVEGAADAKGKSDGGSILWDFSDPFDSD